MNRKMKQTSDRTAYLTQAAMIAAAYVVLTYLANLLGLANGAVQIRFSEALTVLPYFTPVAIPGLFIGCLVSNLLTGCALPDILFGSLATLAGALGTYALRRWKWLAPLPPVLANAVIVPPVLFYAYGIGPLYLNVITVTLGEVISCGVLGLLLLSALQKYKGKLFG